MKNKKWILAALLALLAIPAVAVFKEENLTQTLKVLLGELREDYNGVTQINNLSQRRIESQHQQLVSLVEQSNELSLMLYSQPQNYTFDLTYALHQATRQYENFKKNRIPFDEIIQNMTVELERYSKLAQTLRNMPPVRIDPSTVPQAVTVMDSIDVSIDTLTAMPSFAVKEGFVMDSLSTVIRDSCLTLAEFMVDHYYQQIKKIEDDSQYYTETDKVLKDAYDYAQSRYQAVQQSMFLEGQQNYARILKAFPRYWQRAKRDLIHKYSVPSVTHEDEYASSWKGPSVWIYSIALIFFLILAIGLANLIVRLTMRWVPYFRSQYFQQHKGLIITLAGIFILVAFLLVESQSGNNFYALASSTLAEFGALLGTIFLSMLIRLNREESHIALSAYLPTLIVAFVVVFMRIIFIPNSAMNLFFPSAILLFTIWQLVMNILKLRKLPQEDRTLLWISFVVMAASAVLSWTGLVMMALLVLVWWFFQLMLLQAVSAVTIIMRRYNDKTLTRRQFNYKKKHAGMPLPSGKSSFIEVTWAYDFLMTVLLPVMGIWSLPLSVTLACKVFNLTNVSSDIFFKPLINVEGVVHLSLFKAFLVISLFFLFRYLIYAAKAFYRVWRTRATIKKMTDPAMFKESDINYNLADNIITLVGWFLYILIIFVMLKIPATALTIVSTGLATGIGFAMKDVLNNFFYGVQLMGGRVRVGDTIECDGIRGKVESLSYQSTQVASEDGSIIAFTNTALFNQNFKNLTRNHQYEMINFTVGVKYGTDVEKARQVIREALEPLLGQDKYGRDLVDMKKGIAIRLRNFGDNSIDIQVLLYAAVEVHYSFAAQAKEAIYNAFNANGIEIPFPQRDVYIKQAPGD